MDYARYREQLDNLVQGDYARAKARQSTYWISLKA